MGSIYYLILSGSYLGQWGDYESCLKNANQGNYVLATINGKYIGTARFTRGGSGKFVDFSTRLGLCVPKQCNMADLQ